MGIFYPSVDDVIEANRKAEGITGSGAGIKRKAAMLLNDISKSHFFASANKRTSFIVAADFLLASQGEVPLKKKRRCKVSDRNKGMKENSG